MNCLVNLYYITTGKKWPKMTKIMFFTYHVLGTIHTTVKWWYLQTYFWVSGFLGGKRAKKVQNDHFCLLHSISQEPYIMIVICGTQAWIDNISRLVFIFSKFWFFGLLGGSKGKKLAQNGEKLCLLCLISQEKYIIWFSFAMHKSKMMISTGVFFFFSFFQNFKALLGVSKGKNWPKTIKKLSVMPCISGTIHYIIFIGGTHV